MDIILKKSTITAPTIAPPSKSVYHRALICAALSGKKVKVTPYCNSNDILATIDCLRAIGTAITEEIDGYTVECNKFNETAKLNCRECGSTLRFMLPLCAALGIDCEITGSYGLASRPISPLDEILCKHGTKIIKLDDNSNLPIRLSGKLSGNTFEIPGNISSQYISGMMFALAARKEEGIINITGKIESAPYIDITVSTLKQFGFVIDKISEREYHIKSERKNFPAEFTVEGDFSNAAFWMCAGAIAPTGNKLICKGINFTSLQGDKKVLDILRNFGAKVNQCDNYAEIISDKLTGIDIDVSDIPDLVPVLSVVASVAKGKTTFKNVQRLRIKESDRVLSTVNMINNIGGNAVFDDNNIYINGVDSLHGGIVDSVNDHRIAMSAAVASTICNTEVKIIGAEAVNKSYPDFFEELKKYTKE